MGSYFFSSKIYFHSQLTQRMLISMQVHLLQWGLLVLHEPEGKICTSQISCSQGTGYKNPFCLLNALMQDLGNGSEEETIFCCFILLASKILEKWGLKVIMDVLYIQNLVFQHVHEWWKVSSSRCSFYMLDHHHGMAAGS